MPTHYEYPEGMSAEDKRKYRRDARKQVAEGKEVPPPIAAPLILPGGRVSKYSYPAKAKTRAQRRLFRRLERKKIASLDPNAPIGPSSTPERLLDRVCMRCGEPFRAGFGDPVKITPVGVEGETWLVHLGCKKLTDRRIMN